MSGLFGGADMPEPPPPAPPPPPPPTTDQAAMDSDAANRARKRKGRAATILSEGGDSQTLGGQAETVSGAQLLGG